MAFQSGKFLWSVIEYYQRDTIFTDQEEEKSK